MKRFVLFIIGIVFIGVGALLFVKNNNLVKNCTLEVTATVVDMKEELNTDNDSTGYLYYPILEYTVGEETVRVTMDSGSSTPAYEIDSKLAIMCNPNKIKEFYVKGDKSSSVMSYVMMALGVFIAGYGVVVLFKKEN